MYHTPLSYTLYVLGNVDLLEDLGLSAMSLEAGMFDLPVITERVNLKIAIFNRDQLKITAIIQTNDGQPSSELGHSTKINRIGYTVEIKRKI